MAQKNLLGQNILGYNVTELLGAGAFGTVYKIEKTNASGKYVRALKHITIPSDRQYSDVLNSMGGDVSKADDYFAEMLKGIVSEIQILNDLSEKGISNIVRYYENEIVTQESPRRYDIYIMMEYLEPLEDFIAHNDFTVRDVVKLGVDVLNGLSACHDNGVIHRDIKDDNIFVSSNGEYKIGDFGVSKVLKNSSKAESLKGTPNFLAPEVYLGKESYTKSVDLYSLGIVLYRLLNYSRNPFLPKFPEQFYANDEDAAFEKRMNGEIPELPSLGGNSIGNVIVKAISDSSNRFQSAEEFMQALKVALQNTSEEVLSKKIKFNVVPASSSNNGNYDATFHNNSLSAGTLNTDGTSSSPSVHQHLFDTVGEAPNAHTDNSAPIVDVSAINRENLEAREEQSSANTDANQNKGSGILKKIILFLLPLIVVALGAGAYFFILPKFADKTVKTDDSPKVTETKEEEKEDTLSEIKKIANEVTKGESRFKYFGKDIKAYSNGDDYKEYDESNTFSMGGIAYKRGFTMGAHSKYGYANFNLDGQYKYITGVVGCLDGVYKNASYKILADNKLIETLEIKAGYLPLVFDIDITGVKQLQIIATSQEYGGNTIGFGNIVLYNDKNDKPSVYEVKDLPKTAYIGQEVTSYVHGDDYKEYDGASMFKMGGTNYTRGFLMGAHSKYGYTFFNIDGKYKSFSGIVGNLDKKNVNASYNVLGDGKLLGTIEVVGGGLPKQFNFDVTGVKQLQIVAVSKKYGGNVVGFADVVLQ